MAKGYWVVHVDVSVPDAYKDYRAFVEPFLAKHGGRFLIRGGRQIVAEGTSYPRTVVIEFPSMDEAERAYHSEEYQQGKTLRDGISETNFVIIEGYGE
jgi:uncharacterized protein (DUF1330 family)